MECLRRKSPRALIGNGWTPSRARWHAWSNRQDELAQRQEELEQRLLRIEAAVGLAPAPPRATAPEPEPVAAAPLLPPHTPAFAADAASAAARNPVDFAGR